MTWRDTLARAATIIPSAAQQHRELESLLASVLSGTATPPQITHVVGVPGNRRDGFIESLAASVTARTPEVPLNAARAVLYYLPHALMNLRADPDLSRWAPAERTRLESMIVEVETRERELAKGEPVTNGTLRCPRCGWGHVVTRHTDELERRFMEVRCEACGMYGSWFEGDDESLAWEREQP